MHPLKCETLIVGGGQGVDRRRGRVLVAELQLNESHIETLTGNQVRGIRTAERVQVQARREPQLVYKVMEPADQM